MKITLETGSLIYLIPIFIAIFLDWLTFVITDKKSFYFFKYNKDITGEDLRFAGLVFYPVTICIFFLIFCAWSIDKLFSSFMSFTYHLKREVRELKTKKTTLKRTSH